MPSAFAGRHLGVDRLNALTDGVIAIAITLLVFSIQVPQVSQPDETAVRGALSDLLPSFEMYVSSFFLIGFFWQMHHRLFHRIRATDKTLAWLNLAYLLPITCMPFTTELVGRYRELVLPTVLYFAILSAAAGMQLVLWRHALRRDLVDLHLDVTERRYLSFYVTLPLIVYVLGLAVSLVAPQASQRVYFLLLLLPLERRYLARRRAG